MRKTRPVRKKKISRFFLTRLLGFATALIVLIWGLQALLFPPVYRAQLRADVKRTAERLAVSWKDGVDLDQALQEETFRAHLTIQMRDGDGALLAQSGGSFRTGSRSRMSAAARPGELEMGRSGERLRAPSAEKQAHRFTRLFETLKAAPEREAGSPLDFFESASTVQDNDAWGQTLYYGLRARNPQGGTLYVLIQSPMNPVDQSVRTLTWLWLPASALALLLASLLAYFLAKRFSEPLLDLSGRAGELAAGHFDVRFRPSALAELDTLADTLNQASKELGETDALRRDLIANVSHDLRTPLTSIRMYGEMIRDIHGDDAERRGADCDIILQSCDRLSDMISDALDLSRLESGNLRIRCGHFDLAAMTRALLDEYRQMPQIAGYSFADELEDAAPTSGDYHLLRRAAENLLNNAINYSGDAREIRIRLIRETGSESAGREAVWRWSVEDRGPGIAAEVLPHIWERYYRAPRSEERTQLGTGLGLSLVRQILEAHHAVYGVTSTQGQGSCFYFELPVAGEQMKGDSDNV